MMEARGLEIDIEVDGGIKLNNVKTVLDARREHHRGRIRGIWRRRAEECGRLYEDILCPDPVAQKLAHRLGHSLIGQAAPVSP